MSDIERLLGRFYDAGGAVFNIMHRRYGGENTGLSENDTAINQALVDVKNAGGGRLIFPPGTYLIDSINLSLVGVPLVIEAWGATLVKSGTTATHMFKDTSGLTNNITFLGGKYNLSRSSFSNGSTVSMYHSIRVDDITLFGCYIYDGVEEGLKLYGPRRVKVISCRFENIRNDGIQVHNPLTDQHTGTVPKRDVDDIYITGCTFKNIDDGAAGALNGQGVTFNSTDPNYTTKNGRVIGNLFENCIRGIWTEFNTEGSPGENFQFNNNVVINSISHGIGFVGIEGGTVIGNRFHNIGSATSVSSEKAAIILSGSSAPRPQNKYCVCVGNSVVDDRGGSAIMQYGIIVKQSHYAHIADNRIFGHTTKAILVDRNTTITKPTIRPTVSPQAQASLAVAPTIGTGSWTQLDWDKSVYDTDNLWNSLLNPNRMTPNTVRVGKYRAEVRVSFSSNATGIRGLRLRRNNGSLAVVVAEDLRPAVNGDQTTLQCTVETEIAADQWLECLVYQNSGGNLSIANADRCFFTMRYLDGEH